MGTNFAYEDISGRSTEEDRHSLEAEDDAYYTIKSAPKDPGSVEFSYFVTKINKDSYVPEKADYYDNNGRLYKTIEALEVKDIQGYPTVTKMRSTDHASQGYTVSEFTNVEYDVGLNDDIFTERYLRRPPRRFMGR